MATNTVARLGGDDVEMGGAWMPVGVVLLLAATAGTLLSGGLAFLLVVALVATLGLVFGQALRAAREQRARQDGRARE